MFVFEIWHHMSGLLKRRGGGRKKTKGKTDERRRTFLTGRNRPAVLCRAGEHNKGYGERWHGSDVCMTTALLHTTESSESSWPPV